MIFRKMVHNDCRDYSIGEVAKMLNVPVHTVRFWTEQFKHIECLRRNNRRYYNNDAIEELKKIKELSHKKCIKIEGIKQMLKYHKIDMEKLNKVNEMNFQIKIDSMIKKINKIIDLMNKN